MRRLLTALLLSCAGTAAATVVQIAEEGSGLPSWQWKGEGVSFTFSQRLPDQTRAFFQGRGFSPEQAEPLATDCVFQAIVRNAAATSDPLTIDLAEWRVTPAGSSAQAPRLEAQWQQLWEQRGVSQAARIAFRWALFPTQQRFAPGDWNMGMITFGLPQGSRFDLDIVWRAGEKLHRQRFPAMQCATDN